MPEPTVTLSLKLEAGLKTRLQAEATTLGKTLSGHARDVLAGHFEVQSVAQIREELAELTAAITDQRDHRSMGGTPSMDLARELSSLRETVGLLASSVHHALRVIVVQDGLEPSPEQLQELDRQFETLRARYRVVAKGEA